MKKKTERQLPPLCEAVKRVRAAFGDSQERFANRVGVVAMTISKFETGQAVPKDPRVLLNLSRVAFEKCNATADETARVSLINDGALFQEAYKDCERVMLTDREVGKIEPRIPPTFRSMREWRLSCAARLAVLYYPERVAAIEDAAGPAVAIVDEVLAGADENQINYEVFEREVFALAERQMVRDSKKRKEPNQ